MVTVTNAHMTVKLPPKYACRYNQIKPSTNVRVVNVTKNGDSNRLLVRQLNKLRSYTLAKMCSYVVGQLMVGKAKQKSRIVYSARLIEFSKVESKNNKFSISKIEN